MGVEEDERVKVLREMDCAECGNPEGHFCAGGPGCHLWVIDKDTLAAQQAVIKAAREHLQTEDRLFGGSASGLPSPDEIDDLSITLDNLRAALAALDGDSA